MSESSSKKLRRPAIRSGIGTWNYYVSSMTFPQVAEYVKMPDEIYKSQKLGEMVQRGLTDNADAIVEYIQTDKERFFNALVLAVYDGEPKWHEGVFEYEEDDFYNIGVLEFDKDVRIFPVDGQHRVAAIKKVVENDSKANENEEIPVIFIAHRTDEDGTRRTRRLFTTLNRYAKPVKLNEIIALDEDDIVAITTRCLVEEYRLFSDEKIDFSKTESIPESDKSSFTNIITLYKCNDALLKCFLKKKDVRDNAGDYKRFRKDDETINEFYQFLCSFWELLISSNKDVRSFFDETYEGEIRGKKGGNLLFRPIGLRSYVEAVCEIFIKTSVGFDDILEIYENLNFDLAEVPWKGILWDGRMKPANRTLAKEMLLYMYDSNLLSQKKREGLPERYAEIKGLDFADNEMLIREELAIPKV